MKNNSHQHWDYPLYKQDSGCPTSVFQGGVSKSVCRCSLPDVCPGIKAVVNEVYDGNMEHYWAWGRMRTTSGPAGWAGHWKAGLHGKSVLHPKDAMGGMEAMKFDQLMQVRIEENFDPIQNEADRAKITAYVVENKDAWLAEVREFRKKQEESYNAKR